MEIKPNDQVVHRRVLQGGRGNKQIRIGTVVALGQDGTAVVQFPADNTKVTLPVSSLEQVSARFGRTRVQIDPVRRGIGRMIR